MEGVRPATPEDLPRLLELYAALKLELDEYRGRWYEMDAWPEPAAAALERAVAAAGVLVIVGTIDDVAVGYAVCEVVATLPQASERLTGRIRDLFVEVGAREVSVGEALLSGCIDWLRERGCHSADICVLPGHRAAKNFCETNGFTARSLTMHARW